MRRQWTRRHATTIIMRCPRRAARSTPSPQRDAPLPHRLRDRRGAGMIIGTALGFSDVGTIVLAVALAFLFGYSLTACRFCAPAWPSRRSCHRARIGHAQHRDHGDRRQRDHGCDPRCDRGGRRERAVLGLPLGGARDRRCGRLSGQPLADRQREGARGRAQDRYPRRPRQSSWSARSRPLPGSSAPRSS